MRKGIVLVSACLSALLFGSTSLLEAAPRRPGKLVLSLDPSLDGGGDVKVTTIAKASLLNAAGKVVKKAKVKAGLATFSLSRVTAGDYFIVVNDLADDLVPTRVDDPWTSQVQSVGTKLRASLVGPSADPTYRVKTFSKGQNEHATVKYSDGSVAPPERYDYAVVSFKTTPPKIEIRQMGTGELVLEERKSATTPHPFATWVLGGSNHGKPANYASDASCNACHGSLDSHPTLSASVSSTNGWCFKCHYGKGGDPNGFVDASYNVASTGVLVLALDPALDGGGTVKATSITTAELLDATGIRLSTATIAGGVAIFPLSNVDPQDAFVKVNGLADDLVPTRITDRTNVTIQSVGTKLRFSVIGPATDPTFKLKTYSLGQGEHAVRKWTDGTDVSPAEYGYAVQSLKTTPKYVETRVLGTGALILRTDAASFSHTAGQGSGTFGDWMLGANNHGKPANYVADTSCMGCHGASLDTKAATWGATTTTSGWCFKCHYGKGGDGDGFIDPNK